MSHSPTRIAAAALLGVTAAATLVAVPAPADAATPKKNTVYKAVFTDPVYEITAAITIRIGNDKGRVKKVTAVLSCEAGTQIDHGQGSQDRRRGLHQGAARDARQWELAEQEEGARQRAGQPGQAVRRLLHAVRREELMAMKRSRLAAPRPARRHAGGRAGGRACPRRRRRLPAQEHDLQGEDGTIASVETTLKVTIKIGGNTHKVAKLVAKLTCAEGKQKFVHKNLAIDEHGYITKEKRYPSGAPKSQVFGQFVSKHKVDRGSVYGDETKPCGGHTLDFVAKD